MLWRRIALSVTSSPSRYTPRSLNTVPLSSGEASARLNGMPKSHGITPSFQSLPT